MSFLFSSTAPASSAQKATANCQKYRDRRVAMLVQYTQEMVKHILTVIDMKSSERGATSYPFTIWCTLDNASSPTLNPITEFLRPLTGTELRDVSIGIEHVLINKENGFTVKREEMYDKTMPERELVCVEFIVQWPEPADVAISKDAIDVKP